MMEFKAVKLVRKTYDNLLNEIAKKYGLTLNELKILKFIKESEGKIFAQNIVDGLGSTKSHISMSVSELESNGFITREQDSEDKKKNHLILTKKSYKIIEEALGVETQLKSIIVKDISKEELDIFKNILDKFASNLEEYNSNKFN